MGWILTLGPVLLLLGLMGGSSAVQGPTSSHLPPGPTSSHLPPGQTSSHLPPGLTSSHLPPGLTSSHLPPGLTSSHLPPGLTSSHLPPGLTSSHLPPENCTDYRLQFGRVYSVPGDVAMLNSTLVDPNIFNHTTVPHNISWYNPRTGRELSNETGRILVRGETLWFLRVELEDAGEYVCVVRTPSWCYRQATKLEVDQPVAGECGRPKKAIQMLTNGVNDKISCPLKDYKKKLDSYSVPSSITWHKGCTLIEDVGSKFSHWDVTNLKVEGVDPNDNGPYTCTLTFILDGVMGSISETIDVWVKVEYVLLPQVHEPSNEIIKAKLGSSFKKWCRVFVPCVGMPWVDIVWMAKGNFIDSKPSDRVYSDSQHLWAQESPSKGVWLELLLTFSELKEEDFHMNYTCRAYSDRGFPEGHFTLLPADPNVALPIGLVLSSVAVLFVASVVFYYLFKIDIVLWVRRAFPVLYKNTDLDGKLYDAYVAYPRHFVGGASQEVEMFALHMLPQVLEKTCGYKLFIVGRDCLPGQAIVDSVEENIQASRRLLLLYTAHTFSSGRHNSSSSNNNNIPNSDISSSKSSDHQVNPSDHQVNPSDHQVNPSDLSSSKCSGCGGDGGCPDGGQLFEREAAMHRVLLEGSLKVVLVEMEEVTPAQLALLPESVRHLRKKQGAMCWWKNQATRRRRRTCFRGGADEEKGGLDAKSSPSLSPSSRFWKEMRYHMPVRGKRAVYPEKMALLTL